jgi:hypothetical protein
MTKTTKAAKERPSVRLVGADGNAFMVMGLCFRAARKAGWSKERIEALKEEMMSGNYQQLLEVAMRNFDVV